MKLIIDVSPKGFISIHNAWIMIYKITDVINAWN